MGKVKCAYCIKGYCYKDLRKCRARGCPHKTEVVSYPIKEIKKEKSDVDN